VKFFICDRIIMRRRLSKKGFVLNCCGFILFVCSLLASS
jgi:hypothetical protein